MLRRSLSPSAARAAVAAPAAARAAFKPFTAKGTAPLPDAKGFTNVTTDPLKVGFIAAFAENGGLRAVTTDGNVLTIAFTADDTDGVASTQEAFTQHAPAGSARSMNDIMESERNAVLVWTARRGAAARRRQGLPASLG